MTPARLLLPMMAFALLFLTGCGLVISEKREINRLNNNFIARLNKQEWNRAKLLTSDTFVFIDFEGVEHKSIPGGVHAMDHYTKLIADLSGRDIVDFTPLLTTKINETTYLVKVKMQVRIQDPHRSINWFWTSQAKWIKAGNVWRLEEIKDLSVRERITGD